MPRDFSTYRPRLTSKEVLAEAGSHGFRPGQRAHDVVKAARKYVQSGKCVVIDRLRKRIDDAGVIRLIRAYLNAGIMAAGVVSERHLGTPQGGPLSPLLANVLFDEVDKVLEARGYPSSPSHRRRIIFCPGESALPERLQPFDCHAV